MTSMLPGPMRFAVILYLPYSRAMALVSPSPAIFAVVPVEPRKGGDTRVVVDPSPAVLHHTGQHRLPHQEGRVQVDAHRRQPVLRADAQQLPPCAPPGVIHHHVNTAKFGQSLVDKGLDLLLVGHITTASHHFHPEW